MGQQIPFQTLDMLANGVIEMLPDQQIKPRLRTVKIADQVLQRIELDIDGKEKDAAGRPLKHYELHLYETYWAPKTEGVAKLTDIVSFLWDGGLRGILNSMKSFQRAMFGRMATFSIRWFTPLWLCLTTLILLALTAINAVVLAAAGAHTGLAPLGFLKHWSEITALASCMVAVAFSFGAMLFVADLGKPQELTTLWRTLVGSFCWFATACTVLNIVGTAALMTAILHVDWVTSTDSTTWVSPDVTRACIAGANFQSWFGSMRNCVVHLLEKMPCAQLQGFATEVILMATILVAVTMIIRAVRQSSEERLHGHWLFKILAMLTFILNTVAFFGSVLMLGRHLDCWRLPACLHFLENPVWVWPFLILFSAKVREILVQYVGDVAIYIRPNKLDRFDEVRSKIKEAARSVALAIFTAYKLKTNPYDASEFQYQKIALVGHSLGSVIAYDTLNRLMLDDWLCHNALKVAERTATMVTFASPLNKTAFLFTIQGKDSLRIRERLASTVQPLIMSYPKFRKLQWINVYSRNDIVSGCLKFYDLPGYQDK